MTKKEYIDALKTELAGYDQAVVADILGEFESHFAEAATLGLTEDKIIAELGTIKEVSENIKSMYGTSSVQETGNTELPVETDNALIKNAEEPKTKDTNLEHGNILPEVDTIEVIGDVDVELIYAEGEGYWDYTPSTSIFFNSPFWKRFWNQEEEGTLDVEFRGTTLHFSAQDINGTLKVAISDYVKTILLDGNSMDVDARNISVDVFKGKTYSGDFSFKDCQIANVALRTESGDIDAVNIFGAADFNSKAGDIDIENHQGPRLQITSSAGDIDVVTTSPEVLVETKAGDIDLTMNGPILEAKVKTAAGDVDFESRSKDYVLTASTSVGDIENETGLPRRGAKRPLIIGEGSGVVTISTSAGDITIR